jgi:hypothetical protein
MNPTDTTTTAPRAGHPPDDLDRLLGDFFKGQMREPWPPAPVPAEPVSLAGGPPPVPAPPRPPHAPAFAEHGTRARLTLAVSVALLLGGCWVLSNGFQAGTRSVSKPSAPDGQGVLKPGSAEGAEPLKTMQKDKALKANDPIEGFVPGPINLP